MKNLLAFLCLIGIDLLHLGSGLLVQEMEKPNACNKFSLSELWNLNINQLLLRILNKSGKNIVQVCIA
jgi:hypothetical protein